MTPYTLAIRAVGSFYAKQLIRTGGLIGMAVFIALMIATWALAHYFSSYWWLALIFILPLSFIGLVVFLFSYSLANLIYKQRLTAEQKALVKDYVEKIKSIVETTQYSFFSLLFVISKDLLLYRELRTLQQVISNSTSLKRDLDILASKLQ